MPQSSPSAVGVAAGFPALTRELRAAGLLERRRGAYLGLFALNAVLVAVGVTVFVTLGASWWQPLTAVLWGLVSTQLAFVGHDAGHRQILATRRRNDVLGYVHGALVGMSYGAWVDKHNRHHAHPNHADDDPDIDIPVLAFSADQAATRRGFARWVVGHQAVMFLPLLLLEGWSLHLSSAVEAWHGRVPRPRLEGTLLLAHAVAYLTAVLAVLTPLQALVFVVVHQGVWGLYMGLAFAPNHKGMPVIESGRRLDHLHKQVLTSRNVRGGPVVDLVLGGLNYQIEHHLFPTMPRPSLRRAQVIVRAFCLDHALPYTEATPLGSYAAVLRHLHAVGAPARARAGATGPPGTPAP